MQWAVRRIEANLDRMNAALKTKAAPELLKELVFNRVRVLQAEGYVDDVAFVIALREYGFV